MIRLVFSIITSLLFSNLVLAQEKKYQGLLWEISGNGLNEPSYLYGTMHVSNKLAFNVCDSFYICLGNVDASALESSPDTWMDDYRTSASGGGANFSFGIGGLYNDAFKIMPPVNWDLHLLLENKNSLMNQILFRYHPGYEDYEENTFLDMFIFQSARKANKPCFSLETTEEVQELMVKALTPDDEYEREYGYNSYLEKDYVNKKQLLEDYYRRGDLDKLDSLNKSDNLTESFHHYFIEERNKNMVRRMDSLMEFHSLFIGIGAAHLPGEFGAIELLRAKGYTVRAVSQKTTGKSHKLFKKFNEVYRPISFQPHYSDDKFFSVAVPDELYGIDTYVRGKMEALSPEPINGGYFSVERLFTFGPLFNKDADFYRTTFDSIIYISTPGEIVKKTELKKNGYDGYQILSKTSKNSYISYSIFFTPTEIVMFKGSGNGKYISRSEPQEFFNSIELKAANSSWSEVSPKFGGAKWKMKGLVTGQDMIEGMDHTQVDPLYQSYSADEDEYMLVMRYSYNDLSFIEEDSFDLAYLGKTFAESIGYEVSQTEQSMVSERMCIDQVIIKDEDHKDLKERMKIRTIAKGGSYYIMVSTSNDQNTNEFFNSFEFTDFKDNLEYEIHYDSAYYFKVETQKQEDAVDYYSLTSQIYNKSGKKKENTDFESKVKDKSFSSAQSGEKVQVSYVKFHDYDGAISLSDFWDYRTRRLTKYNGLIVSRTAFDSTETYRTMSFLLTDTNSTRGIMTKFYLQHGVLYTLRSLIDTIDGPSHYVETFYNTFEPLDTLIGRDIFEDKAELFFDHIFGEDSLNKVNAMKSIDKVDFEEKDFANLIKVYDTYPFEDEDDELDYKEDIIMVFGGFDDPIIYDFYRRAFNNSTFDAQIQFAILRSLSYTETDSAYNMIKDLLLTNTPLTDKFGKTSFFGNLWDSLELSINYYPDLLALTSYPEFKVPVIELLAVGMLRDVYTVKNYIAEKTLIQRDANIELKRTIADQGKGENEKRNRYYDYELDEVYTTHLLDYYILMAGLKQNGGSETDVFFQGIEKITDKRFHFETQIYRHHFGLEIDTSKINICTRSLKYRVWAYYRLRDNDMLAYFDSTLTQQDMVEGYLYHSEYDPEEDTLVFLEKVFVDNGKESGYVYFYKRKSHKAKNWMIDYTGLQPENEEEFDFEDQDKSLGLLIKNDDEMDQTMEKAIENFLYAHRKRVVDDPFANK